MTKTDNNRTLAGWEETTLGDVSLDVSYGYTASASIDNVGPKFLRITDIQDDFINWRNVPYCRINKDKVKQYELQIGDVVVARTGNSTGATATIKESVNAIFASYLIRYRINPSVADYNYVDFLLRSHYWRGFVKSNLGGSAQAGANAKVFAGFPIILPPLPEQKAIADVLSSLDNKIELLRRQNETLEKIAQAIFKEWFVDFNFPDKNGKPHKDSGGKMTDSELGEIPEGWRVGVSGDYIKAQGGYAFKSKDFLKAGNHGIIKIKNIQNSLVNIIQTDFISDEIASTIDNRFKLTSGDMLIAMTGAEVAKIGLVPKTNKKLWLNQRVGLFKDKVQHGVLFIYHLFTKPEYQQLLRDRGSGSSAQPNISSTDIESIPVIIASENTLSSFGKITNPMFEKIVANYGHIQTLSNIRDTLLPKLMSGALRVGET